MSHPERIRWLATAWLVALAAPCVAGEDVGPFVRALWLVQRYGTAESVAIRNDQKVKGQLAKALGKAGILTETGVRGLMDPSTFDRLAGSDGKLDAGEVR